MQFHSLSKQSPQPCSQHTHKRHPLHPSRDLTQLVPQPPLQSSHHSHHLDNHSSFNLPALLEVRINSDTLAILMLRSLRVQVLPGIGVRDVRETMMTTTVHTGLTITNTRRTTRTKRRLGTNVPTPQAHNLQVTLAPSHL